jgi:hypothetical protein
LGRTSPSAPPHKGGEKEVKDETPILHTLIFCHSKVYTLCEGVKDFSLKVYGECIVLLLPSDKKSLPPGFFPDGRNFFSDGSKIFSDGSHFLPHESRYCPDKKKPPFN